MRPEERAAIYVSHKLEWMSRRLRWINDPQNLLEWTNAMEGINRVLLCLKKSIGVKSKDAVNSWKLVNTEMMGRRKKNYSNSLPMVSTVWAVPETCKPVGHTACNVSAESRPSRKIVQGKRPLTACKGMEVDMKTEEPHAVRGLQTDMGGIDFRLVFSTGIGGDEAKGETETKVREWGKEALWRQLKLWGRDPGYWDNRKNFTGLLAECSEDKRSLQNYQDYFPKKDAMRLLERSLNKELCAYMEVQLKQFYRVN